MIKKGDEVVVRSGDDRGKKGKVLKMMRKKGFAVVEGVNVVKRHERSRREGKKGQVIEKPSPIRISKLAPAGEAKRAKKK